ncbi:MAG: photosystem II stability/assembly factor-like uncharacterized protein [Verrucomicrobiales bacterium]|jgi:photosystem II stability/assembly factor-like uncharacterized protein
MKSNLSSTLMCLLSFVGLIPAQAEDAWIDLTAPLLKELTKPDVEPEWPGGCSGVVVNRLTGDVTVKVVGQGLWRSGDQGKTWKRVDQETVSGRDETGWATSVDQNAPGRIASFSLDGTAGWTADGKKWNKFTDLGRNWDYGSVDWSAANPKTIIAAKHETKPPGEVYATADGGVTWKQLTIHLEESRGEISMIGALGKSTFIYSIGEGIHRSTDFGKTWNQVSTANPQTRIPVFFKDAYYLGTASGLLVSRDQGATWKIQGSEVSVWQGPFFGHDAQSMLVVGKERVHVTADGGTNWKRVASVKPKEGGFLFTTNWFGCYAWDPVNQILYASSMGNPVFKLNLSDK